MIKVKKMLPTLRIILIQLFGAQMATAVGYFFFGGLIMLSLGVIAEYIWRIYEEVKARPGYIIREKPGNGE